MPQPETPRDGRPSTGLVAEIAATDALILALRDFLTAGVARVELDFTEAGPVAQLIIRAVGSNGTTTSPRDIDETEEALDGLRSAMYRESSGTWFSARISLTTDGSFDAAFNYDDRPPSAFELSASAFVADLERYPRDDEHVPGWLREMLG